MESQTCLECARYEASNANLVPPFIVEGAPILILGDAPSAYELESKTVFVDKQNLIIKMFLTNIRNTTNMPFFKISYANIVQCYSNKKLDAHTIHMCTPKLEAIIAEADPQVIIALGMNVVNALQLDARKLKDVRGTTTKKIIGGKERTIVVTFSIEDILKSPGKTQLFRNNLTNALQLLYDVKDTLFITNTYKETDEIITILDEGIDYINNKYESTGKKVLVALDTETKGSKTFVEGTKIIAVSLCWDPSKGGIAFPTNHKEKPRTNEEITKIYTKLNELINSPKVALTLANGKFDYGFLVKEGLDPIKPSWDIILAEHLLDEDKKGEYSLKVISTDYFPSLEKYAKTLNEEEARIEELYNKKKKEDTEIAQSERYKFIFNEFIHLTNEKYDMLLDLLEGISTDVISLTMRSMLYNWVHFKSSFNIENSYWVCKLPDNSTKKVTMVSLLKILIKLIQIPKIGMSIFPKSVDKYIDEAEFKLKSLIDNNTYERDFELYDLDVLLTYAAMDALTTYAITTEQVKRFRRDDERIKNIVSREVMEGDIPSLFYTMNKLSMPLSRELSDIEYQGITLDRERILEVIAELKDKYTELKSSVYSIIDPDINIFSDKQLGTYLYETLKLPPVAYTKSGAPSVDEKTLDVLSGQNDLPILKDIISLKKISKALKTYLNNWYDMSKWDNKLHASFNIIGTATGRLSSTNPNLQNVPAYLAGVNMKSMFIPDSKDYVFVDCDINNAEMRVLCAYSKEPNLIMAFEKRLDQHSLTAQTLSGGDFTYEMLNEKKDDKTTEEYLWRQIGKRTNFGTIFGITAIGLVQQAPINLLVEKELNKRFKTEAEKEAYLSTLQYSLSRKGPTVYGFEAAVYMKANQIINTFFQANPGVKNYIDRTQYFVDTYKLTLTLTGRRRRFEIGNYDMSASFKAKRQSINARIQGTSSDIVTNNLVCINKVLKHLNIGRVLITVHDSICFQVKRDYLDLVKPMLDLLVVEWVREMFPWMPVDWAYGAEYGENYGEAHNALPDSGKDFFTVCAEKGISITKEELYNLLVQ